MTGTNIAVAICLALLVLCIIVTYITYKLTFKRRRTPVDVKDEFGLTAKEYKDIEELQKIFEKEEYEAVSIKSYDGLTLVGRYYHTLDGAPLDILFHGYRSSPTHDFCGGVHASLEAGHNVLLVYQRAHGKSEGKTITFGAKERYDALAWINYAISRFGNDLEIILTGISMGAATVILTSALDIPENVKGVIADCPYSSAKEIVKRTVKTMKLPAKILYPFIRLGGMIYGKFDANDADVAEAAKYSKVPILLIHGDADSFVPKYMSDEIYRNRGGVMTYHVFPDADHGLAFVKDPERYKKICGDFIAECITQKTEGSKTN